MKRIVPAGRKLYSTFEECLNMKKISRRSFLAAAGLSVAALALPGQVRLKVRSIPVRDAAPCLNALEQKT